MKMLIDENGKKLILRKIDKDIHTHQGIVKAKDLKKTKAGKKVKTHIGKEFIVLDADFLDLLETIQRGPQIITPKDAGAIIALAGIGSGSKVLEAGGGCGGLTAFLARVVGRKGKVYSYEVRKDYFELLKNNLKMLGLDKSVKLVNKNVKDAKEKNLDAVILDLPEPWDLIKMVEKVLKPGGRFIAYIPTVNQVINLLKALENSKLVIEMVSRIVREDWQEKPKALRPKHFQLYHTAFLVATRKITS